MSTIGIDLGTSNSAAAWASADGRVHMLKSNYGPTVHGDVFPSYMRVDTSGRPVKFGEPARLDLEIAPGSVVWGTKRFIGRGYDEALQHLHRLTYRTSRADDGTVSIDVSEPPLSAEAVAAALLGWIRECANNTREHPFIEGPVTNAVIAHPAYFDPIQIQRTKEAAARAGFAPDGVSLIAEPVAAAIAYGFELSADEERFVFAIDWGAGTLDIASVLLRLDPASGRPRLDQFEPAAGDIDFGGIDMDDALVRAAITTYGMTRLAPYTPAGEHAADGRAPGPDAQAEADLARLRACLESGKIELSTKPTFRGHSTLGGAALQIRMARTRRLAESERLEAPFIVLEDVLAGMLDRFQAEIEAARERTGLSAEHFHHVLLVGGPMHMPSVRERVRRVFQRNRAIVTQLDRIDREGFPVDPIEAVARGAALAGRRLTVGWDDNPNPFAFGIALGTVGHEFGQILVEVGSGPGEYPHKYALLATGTPGRRIPVGLYKRVDDLRTGRETYTRLGEFAFVPIFKNGQASFRPILEVAPDRTMTIRVRDEHRDPPSFVLELKRLDALSGKPIDRPTPFADREDDDEGGHGPEPTSNTVAARMVAHERSRAQLLVQLARTKLADAPTNHPDVLEEINALERALHDLPVGGDADQLRFQQAVSRSEQLRALLQTARLLTDEEAELLVS